MNYPSQSPSDDVTITTDNLPGPVQDQPIHSDVQTEDVDVTELEAQVDETIETANDVSPAELPNDVPPLELPNLVNQDSNMQDVETPEEVNTGGVIAPENRDDEIPPPQVTQIDDADRTNISSYTTRSGRQSKPYDFAARFPEVYADNHYIDSSPSGKQIRPYYFDERLNKYLSEGTFISDSFYSNDIKISSKRKRYRDRIKKLSKHEYQMFADALQFCGYQPKEIEAMMYKVHTMSVKEGIRRHGKDAKASAMKEIKNLVKNECFGVLEYEKLTQEMEDKALPILMFMIIKRNGLLKTRGVADGSVQRLYTNKDDVSSPTPDFYSFKYICAIIAKECRDVATVDLPGFSLQTEQDGDKDIILKLSGEVALLLVECDEDRWKKHLRKENGKWVLYTVCKKAIYGTMNAALLAYKKLAKLFKSMEMEMNPYDPCVWNKIINGKQLTVIFHIDDLLISHAQAEVVTEFIERLKQAYGQREDLTVTRGRVHEYLGMTIDFNTKFECAFSQYDFLKKLFNSLPKSLKCDYRNSPAPEFLFKVNDEATKLDPERKEQYHNLVAKVLWASQRSRPDVQLANAFHCTRVKEPDEHDWMKLGQMIGYLRKTRFIPLIIGIGDEGTMIYIDGAHAVHSDAKGHSGLYVTQGKGAMINVSKKLGVVTTSSTETEIVSTGERLPKCTWFRYFRLAQGEEEKEDILLQDNKSAITLQKRWPYSTRKGSKHIHVRYFFAVDKITNKELKILYCPTDKMVADYNSKPLQGKLFTDLRNLIMGVKEQDFLSYKNRYAEVLKQYDLFDDTEKDLWDL